MLRVLENEIRASDDLFRFAGHQAIIQNHDSVAYKLFANIREKAFSDYLGGAMAASRLGEWKTAEEMLDMGTRVSWSEKISEISILHGLLIQIRQNAGLKLFKDTYVNRLAEKIGADIASSTTQIPDARKFCPDE